MLIWKQWRNRFCAVIAFIVALSVIGCGGAWDRAIFSPTTAVTKQRHYNIPYDFVLNATYRVILNNGMLVKKLDSQMGTLVVSKSIGAYNSGWADWYVIFLTAKTDNRTRVQVKYQPIREGTSFTPIGSSASAQNASSGRTDWHTSNKKVNDLLSQIQRELGMGDILGFRGLIE